MLGFCFFFLALGHGETLPDEDAGCGLATWFKLLHVQFHPFCKVHLLATTQY